MAGKFSRILLLIAGSIMFFSVNCVTHSKNLNNDDLNKKIIKIIDYGALAPSTHNAQMWKIKIVAADKFRVLLDEKHILPQVDPGNRESMISLGAFIENAVEAAPYFGLQAEVRILAQDSDNREVAELTFHSITAPPLSNDGLNNIKNRHTIRIPYLPQDLWKQDIQWLKSMGSDLYYFPRSGKEGHYIQTAIIEATKKQVANDNKQQELAGLIRFSKKEAKKEKDGLTPDGMGLSGIAKWFVATFYNHNTVMTQSFRKQTVAATEKQANNCSGFLVLTASDNSIASWINSGRNLEKFLIMATGKHIAVHPMSAPLEESPWNDSFSQKVGIEKPAQMILRIGYVRHYGHPVSQRRKVVIIE
jgi:hypothetical protein